MDPPLDPEALDGELVHQFVETKVHDIWTKCVHRRNTNLKGTLFNCLCFRSRRSYMNHFVSNKLTLIFENLSFYTLYILQVYFFLYFFWYMDFLYVVFVS